MVGYTLLGAARLHPFGGGQPKEPAKAEIEPPPAAIPLHHAVGATAAVTDMRRITLLAQKICLMHQEHMGILTGTGGAEPADPAINLPLQHSTPSFRQREFARGQATSQRPRHRGPCGPVSLPYRHRADLLEHGSGRAGSWQALFSNPRRLSPRCRRNP